MRQFLVIGCTMVVAMGLAAAIAADESHRDIAIDVDAYDDPVITSRDDENEALKEAAKATTAELVEAYKEARKARTEPEQRLRFHLDDLPFSPTSWTIRVLDTYGSTILASPRADYPMAAEPVRRNGRRASPGR